MFYANLERICKARGTSPSAAAMAIGKGRSTASGWKRNGTIPSETELGKLADFLRVNVSDFFVKTEYAVVSLDVESEQFEADIDEFRKIYLSCSSNRQRHLLMSAVYDFEEKVLMAEPETC